MERVFEINRNFRNEGLDSSHVQEFTMLEVYQAHADYRVMMELVEDMVTTAAREATGQFTTPFGEQEIDLSTPWPRVRFADALLEHAGIDLFDEAAVREKAKALGLEEVDAMNATAVVDEVFKQTVEPRLIQPTFLTHHPAEMAPLCRRNEADPRLSERFEVFLAGFELANAYTELNDPLVQREEFERQLERRDEGTVGRMDEDFLLALEHGMPPAGGMGVGIDRLLMILLGKTSMRDVILFPLMRPEHPQDPPTQPDA